MAAHSVSVVVPASSANLGCAFDCAGIALNLYLRAEVSLIEALGIAVAYRGADVGQIPQDETNLVVQAMRRAADAAGKPLPAGLHLVLENQIPLGVGLGSSAAVIVAGIALGTELCGAPLDAQALLQQSLQIESHPDNLAAAIHGGFVVASIPDSSPGSSIKALVARVPVSQELDFIAVIPDVPLPTAKARAALPLNYSREDVVANLQRTALLTAGFFSGQRITPEVFRDRLHQPYRAPLVPGIAACLDYRHAGIAGVFLSGAGSAVMAMVDLRDADSRERDRILATIADDLVAEFRSNGTAARALLLKAENAGTRIVSNGAVREIGAGSTVPA